MMDKNDMKALIDVLNKASIDQLIALQQLLGNVVNQKINAAAVNLGIVSVKEEVETDEGE